ncbi:probable beta-D-xylosidase 2 [Magnolia sinica]|uniref:probable beta-D-xylosidase 2 n=1 Tax=Magnolia sinica TaxID=86752 RepID=UPI00265985A3|nr:probable beta-D-xylosidase 2 [Magnolia sinica]
MRSVPLTRSFCYLFVAGIPCRYITPVEGFSSYAKVHLAGGCYDVKCTNSWLIHYAVDVARNEDASIILVGLDLSIEADSRDRTDLLLPGYQTELINKVTEAAAGPVVLVISLQEVWTSPSLRTIPRSRPSCGQAIVDFVYEKYNPGGRLPLTWYNADYVDQLPITSIRLRPVDELGYPGRTYKFYNGSTVYPFGYGLSYTRFNYNLHCDSQNSIIQILGPHQHCHDMLYTPSTDAPPWAVLIDDLDCNPNVEIDFEVNNIGDVDGTHVVLIYTQPPKNYVGLPLKQLAPFERVFVNAGETRKRKLSLNVCKSFAVVSHTFLSTWTFCIRRLVWRE